MELTVDMCIAGRDLTEPRLSPDGAVVTFVARGTGPAAVMAVPVRGGPERQVTTSPVPAAGRGLGGGCHAWVPDGSGFVYAAVDGCLWFQPFPGGAPRLVAAVPDGAAAQAPAVSAGGSAVAFVVDLAMVGLASVSGDGTWQRLDGGIDEFCCDPWVHADHRQLSVRWQAWSPPDMAWDGSVVQIVTLDERHRVVRRSTVSGAGAIQQPRTLPDGRGIAVRDDSGWLNVCIADAPVVAESVEHAGPTWGPGQRSFAVDPAGRRLAFTRNVGGFGELCVARLDRPDHAVRTVARGVHGQLDWRGEHLVALRTGARTPTQVVAYHVTDDPSWERRSLAVGPVLGWEAVGLPEPELVAVESDGAVLHARRYPAGAGRMLCCVHGGPTDQWQVTFMPRVAYWWSRGFDVLVVDPRGSTGHGREYQQALHGGWGVLDVDDTATLIAHAHREGWATSATTVVVGGSSGGLTVLGTLARHSDLVAGGVAVYPVSDLADLAERSHRFEAHYTLTLVGPLTDIDRYGAHSPLRAAERIRGPLLVLHGDADPVVPVEQSRALVDQIRAAGGDVEFHVFEGEGHGFRDPANRRAEFDLMESFMKRVVGGGANDRSHPPTGSGGGR